MKIKNKTAQLPSKSQSKNDDNNDRRAETRKRIWIQVGAVFLIIVFLASECATLMPLD
jgi:hypothetical protein